MKPVIGHRYERVCRRWETRYHWIAILVPGEERLMLWWRVSPTRSEVRVRTLIDGEQFLRLHRYQEVDRQKVSGRQIRTALRFLDVHLPALRRQEETQRGSRKLGGDPEVLRNARLTLRRREFRIKRHLQDVLESLQCSPQFIS